MRDEKTARPRGTDSARLEQVIVTEAIAGRGIKGDPVRALKQYWSLDGDLIATIDPCAQSERLPQSGDPFESSVP